MSIEDLKEKENLAPFWISLTTNGKTMIMIYPWCGELLPFTQEEIKDRLVEILGAPDLCGWLQDKERPNRIVILWPHQDLPDILKEMAETMTSLDILEDLEEFGR